MLIWDIRAPRKPGEALTELEGVVESIAFSPDGHMLASADFDGVRLWKRVFWRDFVDLKAQVCMLVVGNLTKAEWNALAPGLAYRTTCPN